MYEDKNDRQEKGRREEDAHEDNNTDIIEEPYLVSRATVAFVDARNSTFTTGLINDIYSQVIYHVTGETDIFDRRGSRIALNQIRSGDSVQIEHATFQTASIPPRITAFRVACIENHRKRAFI